MEGFNALTTKAEYYSDDFRKTAEVGICLHMNQQVINKIVDRDTTYTWYDYSEKRWANIKTTANQYEAWWVWIPRYAYKAEEVTGAANVAGNIDVIYVDTSNRPPDTEKYGDTLPSGYQVHPAFDQDTDGSGNKLPGIWFSKYKPSEK